MVQYLDSEVKVIMEWHLLQVALFLVIFSSNKEVKIGEHLDI